MRRNWLLLALLLSVGINCGLVGMGIARHRLMERGSRADRGERPHGEHLRGDRPMDDRSPGGRPFGGERLADRLELTGEARENFLRLQRELAERVHAARLGIEEARRGLRRELVSAEPDRTRVEELLSAIQREQDGLDRALVANVLAAREMLDPEAEREYLRFVERIGAAISGVSGAPGPHRGGFRGRDRP
jgi:Spy/CpxP family protein refolding chaperone